MKATGGAIFWDSIDSLKKDIANLEAKIAELTKKKSEKEAKLATKRKMGGKSTKRSKRIHNKTSRR